MIHDEPTIGPTTCTDDQGQKQRSRAGCLACRRKRVKCNEERPTCRRCQEKSDNCEWPTKSLETKTALKRTRAINSCDRCRTRKIRCDGAQNLKSCQGCQIASLPCTWSYSSVSTPTPRADLATTFEHPVSTSAGFARGSSTTPTVSHPFLPDDRIPSTTPSERPVSDLPEEEGHIALTSNARIESLLASVQNLNELIDVYFNSIHHFAYKGFVHEIEFRSLRTRARNPLRLTILMAANALALSGQFPDEHARDLAENWVSSIGPGVITNALERISPVRLMDLTLYQTFQQHRSTHIRGQLLAGLLTRAMQALSLYNLDERSTYHQYQQSSLVNCESLRRLAWSIIMTDMQVDCGHYGMHTIDDGTYTIQLPCEERSFLIGLDVVTEPIIPVPRHPGSIGNLGLTAHLLRAGLARRRILHSATKLARSMLPTSTIEQSVGRVEQQIRVLLDSLPQQLAYSTAHFLVYRDQQPTLLALHAYRCIAEIAFGRLRMMASDRIPEWQGQISKIRSDRVRHSLALSHLFADAIAHDVAIDPSLDTFVYVALEALLFEPPRLVNTGTPNVPNRDETRASVLPLLLALRKMSAYLPNAAMLHTEAVHRLVRLGFTEDLVEADVTPLFRKLSSTGLDPAEYNFYRVWVRRAVNSRDHDNDPVDPSSLDAETLLDLASESNYPSRARTPQSDQHPAVARTQATARTISISGHDSFDGAVPFLSSSQALPTPPIVNGAESMNWPQMLGEIDMHLLENDGDFHPGDQTLELDPWHDLFTIPWTGRDLGETETGYDASLLE